MNARAISTLLLAIILGVGAPVNGQEAGTGSESDSEADDEQRSEDVEKQPETAPSGVGKLPVEDPTIHLGREEDLAPSSEQEQTLEDDEGPPEREDGSAGLDDAATQPTGSLPVEDPTIQQQPEVEEPATDEAKEPEQESESADWGQRTQVKYAYQGGLLVGVDDWFYLYLSGLLQARYAVNYRTKPPTDPLTGVREKQVTQGFDVARARFHLGIGLTEFVALYMRVGVVAGGNFSFQRAFIDLKWKYLRLRAGLFINELIAESLINPNDHLFNDYSIFENVFTPGSSKGVMLTYLRKRFSINLGYSDGLRTGFSEIRSATRADFAVTLRTQYAWGKRGLGGFNRLVARRGTPFGMRLSGAVHYQDGGRSQGTAPVKIAIGTIDFSMRGNGWSLLVSAASGQDARVNTAEIEDSLEVISTGASVMGGYFVLDKLQLVAQYGVVAKPRVQGQADPGDPNNPIAPEASPSNFQSFGVGLSYFVIPGHDNVKVSTDFQYFLGRTSGSIVPTSPLNNIQPNNDGSQFFWRIQISAAF